MAAKVEHHFQHVARGARLVGDDGDLSRGKRVEQGRLARIGQAGDGDPRAFAQHLAAPVRQRCIELAEQRFQLRVRHRPRFRRHVVLIGEIDAGLDQRHGADEPPAPGLHLPAEMAEGVGEGEPALSLGLGGDEIGEALGLGEVHAPIDEGPPAELAALGRADAGQREECAEHGANHRPSPMDLQLRHVFPGGAAGGGKPQRQPLVEHVAACGMTQPRQRRPAWFGQAPDQRNERGARLRAREPDHRDGGRNVARGHGGDGVAGTGALACRLLCAFLLHTHKLRPMF